MTNEGESEEKRMSNSAEYEVVPDSGEVVESANLDTIVSLRLRSELAATLRSIATRRDVRLSYLLRDAAAAIVCDEGLCTCPSCPRRRGGGDTRA